MNWIDKIIQKSNAIVADNPKEQELVDKLVETALNIQNDSETSLGVIIAAFYDLAIASVYYKNITNSGWIYCKDITSRLILPYVNCCPLHALKGEFVFHNSSKPASAKIGQATTRLLLLFYKSLFDHLGKMIDVLKGTEPADAIFIDKQAHTVLFGEIKSSPLLTLALSMDCEQLTTYNEEGEIIPINHKPMVNTHIIDGQISVVLPVQDESRKWVPKFYLLGKKVSESDIDFAYAGILKLIEQKEFIKDYLAYWEKSYETYGNKDESQNVFWLTNACGKPSRLPSSWTGGSTCISDEKTSVGMDRTDDIKKGIYQILKLGAEGKVLRTSWNYKVGVISNIHPVRHFDVYLKPIKDLIWTIAEQKDIHLAKELPPEQPIYNLYDGIITFTKVYSRDKWVSDLLLMFK